MKQLLLCCAFAVAATGCTISTELDPEGSPKYRQASRGTGTNIARRLSARDMPATRVMAEDDVERMLRGGQNPGKPFQ